MSGRFYSQTKVIEAVTTPPGRKLPPAKRTRPAPVPSSRSSTVPPSSPSVRSSTSTPSPRSSNKSLDHSQSENLQRMLRNMESKIDNISKFQNTNSSQIQLLTDKLLSIENVIEQIHTNSSSGSDKRISRRIPKDLLHRVKLLYSSLEREFIYSERADSKSNKQIFDEIKSELASFDYEPHLVHRAIHRHFESMKRSEHESNAIGEQLEAVNDIKKKRLKCSRRHRKFDTRQKYVKKNEQSVWEKVTADMMTDESDRDGKIAMHSLPWRSEALSVFVKKLDKRHDKNKKSPWIKPKERFEASPSKRPPPPYCPKSFLVSNALSPAQNTDGNGINLDPSVESYDDFGGDATSTVDVDNVNIGANEDVSMESSADSSEIDESLYT